MADHATDPGAEVIHAHHTAFYFAGVVHTIRLPVAALGAPLWAAVALAHKHILGIEKLKARTVGVPIWSGIIGPALKITRILGGFGFRLLDAVAFDGERAERYDTRVQAYCEDNASVRAERKGQEDKVENEDGDGCACVSSCRRKEEGDCTETRVSSEDEATPEWGLMRKTYHR